jgi:putative transposase
MKAEFCIEALKDAIASYGKPEIMNSDQGSQFTGFEWTRALKDAGIKISMDGRGRWIDNPMIERLWRSLKYECIYLNAFETGSQARTGIGKWLAYYNAERPHFTHGILTPDEAYERKMESTRFAA